MKTLILAMALVASVSQTVAKISILPTRLKITVLDELGNTVEGATVKIYASKEDYLENRNELRSELSDEKGVVIFKDLKPKVYYINAEKNALNNDGLGTKTDTLREGRINKVIVVIT